MHVGLSVRPGPRSRADLDHRCGSAFRGLSAPGVRTAARTRPAACRNRRRKYRNSAVSRGLAPVLPSGHWRSVCRAGTGPGAHEESEAAMAGKAVISLTTGLEDPEKVTVAFLVAVGAAESGRPTVMFQAKEAVRLALDGVAAGVACEGCPPLPELQKRYEAAGGRYYVCPICFNSK